MHGVEMNTSELLRLVGSILFSVASGGAIVFALSSWLGKVWASRILQRESTELSRLVQGELEHLRVGSERNLFMHKVQFEAEFDAYQKLWRAFGHAINCALLLRPAFDQRPADKTDKEILAERYSDFATAYNAFLSEWVPFQPFMQEEIDQKIDELARELRLEAMQARNPDRPNYWTDQVNNAKSISDKKDELVKLIRTRIGILKQGGE